MSAALRSLWSSRVQVFVSALSLVLVGLLPPCASAQHPQRSTLDYDILYVRQPRYGDFTNTLWSEVFHPARMDPGADLVLLHPDGTEEVLVVGGNGSVRPTRQCPSMVDRPTTPTSTISARSH